MRRKESKRQRCIEAKTHRKNKKTILASLLLCFLFSGLFASCVRVAGTAGYFKINPDGETTVKRAGFDTADYIPGNSTAEKVTV